MQDSLNELQIPASTFKKSYPNFCAPISVQGNILLSNSPIISIPSVTKGTS